MRLVHLVLSLVPASFAAGCLAGSGKATTTTTHRFNDGVHPAWEESVTQTYSGSTVGASLPITFGGYDPATGMPNGQNGFGGNGSASVSCIQNPDRCASNVTVIAPQPNAFAANGYGVGMMTVAPGGQTQTVGAGSRPGYGPPSGVAIDPDLQDRFVAVEKKTASIGPAVRLQMELTCEMIVSKPDLIRDSARRDQLVKSCKDAQK